MALIGKHNIKNAKGIPYLWIIFPFSEDCVYLRENLKLKPIWTPNKYQFFVLTNQEKEKIGHLNLKNAWTRICYIQDQSVTYDKLKKYIEDCTVCDEILERMKNNYWKGI